MTRFEESLAKWQSVRDAHIAQISKTIEQQALAVLRAIVAEVAGPERPYSADSYLPAHLILDARAVIEKADKETSDAFTTEMRAASRAEPSIADRREETNQKSVEELRRILGFKP